LANDVTPAPVAPQRTQTRALAVVVVLIALVAGIFAGAAGDRLLLLRQHRLMPSHDASRNGTRMLLERLTRQLDLTPSQRAAIDQILQRRRARVDALWSSVRPRVRQEIDEGNAEVERLLTPAQRTKFDAFKMKMQRRAHMRPPL
jgi:Spy/CpxP family protein refolding chaperone